MRRIRGSAAIVALGACAFLPASAVGQEAAVGRDEAVAERSGERRAGAFAGDWSALRVAKWSSVGATVAAAAYGLAASLAADERYTRMERLCEADAGRCRDRLPDGGYADPEIARLDREAAGLDRKARRGLLASQIGVAASVVLFVLDMEDTGAPPNVPYEPSRLRIGASESGGVRIIVRLPTP